MTALQSSDAAEEPARPEPRVAAREAGLRYSSDERPGIERRRRGRGFSYRDADGSTVRDKEVLARIRSLAIPPAWTEVWICPWPNGLSDIASRMRSMKSAS